MLTFHMLKRANKERMQVWSPGRGWTGADWSNQMGGEAGEAMNVVKKLRIAETGTQRFEMPTDDELKQKLADELADTVICADLLAQYYGIDLGSAVCKKFNEVSRRENLPVFLNAVA